MIQATGRRPNSTRAIGISSAPCGSPEQRADRRRKQECLRSGGRRKDPMSERRPARAGPREISRCWDRPVQGHRQPDAARKETAMEGSAHITERRSSLAGSDPDRRRRADRPVVLAKQGLRNRAGPRFRASENPAGRPRSMKRLTALSCVYAGFSPRKADRDMIRLHLDALKTHIRRRGALSSRKLRYGKWREPSGAIADPPWRSAPTASSRKPDHGSTSAPTSDRFPRPARRA